MRAGRGEAVVLLVDDVDAGAVQQMAETLASRFLVIVAAPRLAPRDLDAWLAEFTEGLGLAEAHVLLHSRLCENHQPEPHT